MRASALSTADDTRPKEQAFTRLPFVPFGRLSHGQPGKFTESARSNAELPPGTSRVARRSPLHNFGRITIFWLDGELLMQGEVLQGELAVATAEEREDSQGLSGSEPRDQQLGRRTEFWQGTGEDPGPLGRT